jgi:hypothetical protein
VKTPSYDEIRQFLKADGWSISRRSGHEFYEKVLPSGEILETRASWSGKKTMSPGRFQAILSDQLKVTRQQFWEVIRSGEPATRPSPVPEPAPHSLPKWLDQALRRELGMDDADLANLTEEQALDELNDARSKPRE